MDLHGDERNFLPHICYREEATGWHAHIIGLLPQLKSKQAKVLSSYNPCNQNHIFFFFCANIPQLNPERPSSLPTITWYAEKDLTETIMGTTADPYL